MSPPGNVRWSLHRALQHSHQTTGTIHKPVDEYKNVEKREVLFALEPGQVVPEKPQFTMSSFTSYGIYAIEQDAVESETQNRPKQSESDNPLMIEITPEPLGRGSFGACYKATVLKYDTATFALEPRVVAFKQMNMKESTGSDTLYLHELEMLSSLDHPNIVKYLFACPCTCTEDDVQKKVDGIVMELCTGTTLRSHLRKFQKQNTGRDLIQLISMMDLIEIFNQAAKGLEHIHSREIIHCDVKLDNIMWDDHTKLLKFIDFGVAFNTKSEGRYRRCGTHDYLAPECLNNEGYYCSDIWALGIMMSCLIFQSAPYEMHPELNELLARYKRYDGEIPPDMIEDMKNERKNVITKEIVALRDGKQTCIEIELRRTYQEPEYFWEKYEGEPGLNTTLFYAFCRKIADMLQYPGEFRPNSPELVRDANEWLEAMGIQQQQNQSPDTYEVPSSVIGSAEVGETPLLSVFNTTSSSAVRNHAREIGSAEVCENPMLSAFDKPTSSAFRDHGRFSSIGSDKMSMSSKRHFIPVGLPHFGMTSNLGTDEQGSLSPRAQPEAYPRITEGAVPVGTQDESFETDESGDQC